MFSPNKKSLYAALAGAGLSAAGSSAAVQLSTDGHGEVLLFPYYTTRADSAGSAFATLVSVVNATATAKALRVRFLEGKNSRDVLHFNLFLSPFDVWTAAILPDTSSAGAKIGTFDLSCTLPPVSSSPIAPFAAFANIAYSGDSDDGAGTSLDRTREGYFEIIEMATYHSDSSTGRAVTHVNGIPRCGSPADPLTDVQAAMDAQAPSGGLFGASTLINVNSGTDYSVDAIALSNFHEDEAHYQPIGTALPDLTQALPPISSVHASNGRLYESTWNAGSADAVSAVLMHESLMNEYVLDSTTRSATDWVVTLPTKRHYVSVGSGNAGRLFQRNFSGDAGSCDDIRLSIFNREEIVQTRCGDDFGSCVSGLPPLLRTACWAANVVTFNGGTIFGSTNVTTTSFQNGAPDEGTVQTSFQNGWVKLRFPTGIPGAAANVHQLVNEGATSVSGRGQPTTTGNTVTYVGLPVIGFAAVSYSNGTLVVGSQNVLSNYGGSLVHKTMTFIQ